MDQPRPDLTGLDEMSPQEAAAARQGITDFLEMLELGQAEVVMGMVVRRDEEGFSVAKADPQATVLEAVLGRAPLVEDGSLEQAVEVIAEQGHWVTVEELAAAKQRGLPDPDLGELAGLEDLPGLDGPQRVDEIGDLSGLDAFEDLTGVAGHFPDDELGYGSDDLDL